MSIASCDEAEDEPDKEQEMTLSLVQGGSPCRWTRQTHEAQDARWSG